jgi:hypothetical protein
MVAPDGPFSLLRSRGAAGLPLASPLKLHHHAGKIATAQRVCGAGLSNGFAAKPAPLASLPRWLGARDSIEHFKKIVKLPWKIGVRGLVLTSPEW